MEGLELKLRRVGFDPLCGAFGLGASCPLLPVAAPGRNPGKLAPAPLRVAVGERGPGDRALPPGDAADADRARAADQRHVRFLESFANLGAEPGVDDLGVLVEEYQRLEVVVLLRLVEEEVVV